MASRPPPPPQLSWTAVDVPPRRCGRRRRRRRRRQNCRAVTVPSDPAGPSSLGSDMTADDSSPPTAANTGGSARTNPPRVWCRTGAPASDLTRDGDCDGAGREPAGTDPRVVPSVSRDL